MTISVQVEVFSIVIVTAVLCLLAVIMGGKVKKSAPDKAPEGLANAAIILVTFFDNLVHDNMGEKYVKKISPLIGSIGVYILISNISGLVSLPNPTGNYSVTFTLALIAFVLIEKTQIEVKGLGGFLKGFLDPVFLFLPMNIVGELSPLLSMSMRLFGNIMAGSIIMQLVYAATSLLSSLVPVIGKFNFMGPIIAPVLHAYFDLFSGVIQTYIFIMLATVLAKSKSES